jgi:dTDP-4-dehydrorhamnose reductase
MKALVIGAAGQLGGTMVQRLGGRYEVVSFTRREVDLRDARALAEAVVRVRPDVIYNCAAYNAVDQAEDEPLAALEVNSFAPRTLAQAATDVGATLVHYSTDFVFEGPATQATPYVETDTPQPQSVYGGSKLMGEWFAAQTPKHYVLRVESLFGGAAARSSIDKIIGAIDNGDESRVFVDRIVTPSFVDDVAWASERLVESHAPYGLYHCVNTGETTWYELAEEIGRQLDRPARLVPVRVADVTMKAKRPVYCALSNSKLAEAGAPMPPWQDALRRYVALARARV